MLNPAPFTDLFTQRIHGIDKRKSRGPTNLFDEPNSPFRKLAEDQGLTFELPEHESVTFERNYLKRKKRDREEKEMLESVKRKKEDEEEQIRQEKVREKAERQWYKEEKVRLKLYNDQKRLFEVEQKKKEEQEQLRLEEQEKERLCHEEREQTRHIRAEEERRLQVNMREKEVEDHREAEERNVAEKERLEDFNDINQAQAQAQDMESHQWWLNTMVNETNEEEIQTDMNPQREESTQVEEPKDVVQEISAKAQNMPSLSMRGKSQELEDQPDNTLQLENTGQEILTSPMMLDQPEFSFRSREISAIEQNIRVEQPTDEAPIPPVIPINSQLSQCEKTLDVESVELQEHKKQSGEYQQEQADELQQDWSRQMNEELREQMDDYKNGPMQMFEVAGGLNTDLQNDEVVQTVEMNRSPVLKHRFLSSNVEEDDKITNQVMREKSNSIAHVDEQLADPTSVNDVVSVSDSEDDDTTESAIGKANNTHSEAGSPQDRSAENEKTGENLLESAMSIMKNLAFETIGGRSLRPRPKTRYTRVSKPTSAAPVNSNTFPRKVRVRPIRHYMSFSDEE